MNDQTMLEQQKFECHICLNEIPRTVGDNVEGDEYVLHFFGLDCYQKWRDTSHPNNDGKHPR